MDRNSTPSVDQTNRYGGQVRQYLDEIDERSSSSIASAASLMFESILDNGIIHVAGAGHSLAMVCESFYRAGGLAAVRPIWHPEIFPLGGAIQSTQAERRDGLGRSTVRTVNPTPPDVAVVFSTSGRNPYPVEIAMECQALGVPVIAVTSSTASQGASVRSATNLAEHATIVVDTCTPPGDVIYPSVDPRTGSVSTILAAYAWNLLISKLDDLATMRGVELPRWTSANVEGGDQQNSALIDRYLGRIPELA
ncbi:SIS domain-containing protein [Rhodococcus sp. IEGM 1409]|uniref:SIS domain-containing protein n=1 Tax=Rhodococcus sp. IEGM 1409 TaxID=3047082 RepID=UPI0024B8330A|nr:SIS domain-containing protein [Rhodococcus sp. IEGM 1409]MDI9903171.1 SIS domain-containing protein [Rhodococcus sp. IEGM 1409]